MSQIYVSEHSAFAVSYKDAVAVYFAITRW